MPTLSVFNLISIDGYFKGPNGDISWHNHDAETSKFAVESLKAGNILLFGRLTYELMAGYWPTPFARQNDPVVAEGMNNAEKIVFSRTLKSADWHNTRLVNENIAQEVGKLKRQAGKNLTLLGSGSIVTQLAQEGLIDEYQLMIDPVVLGQGTPLFQGLKRRMNLALASTRAFKNGNVLLCYRPT